ncbi:MAG: hypothetical protein ACOZF0_10515 [Thermodesulfobacteriota bacterium]
MKTGLFVLLLTVVFPAYCWSDCTYCQAVTPDGCDNCIRDCTQLVNSLTNDLNEAMHQHQNALEIYNDCKRKNPNDDCRSKRQFVESARYSVDDYKRKLLKAREMMDHARDWCEKVSRNAGRQ